ncbi:phage tail tube protein [Peribacillus muralis]|uniref:phage tail tube protein n=1 Tax=Peribacillus muralis TaxID=264697 RepID=UPI003671BF6B
MAVGNKIAGVDVLLEAMIAGQAVVIGGQSGATLNRGTNIIEVTSKDSEGWEESVAGIKNWGIDCDGFLVEGNAALDHLETCWLNGATLPVQIAMPSGKKYAGTVLIEDFPSEYPQDDAVSFSLSLKGTGVLTITPKPAA